MTKEIKRCDWARHPLEEAYHDNVWGRPIHNDKELFKMLMLEAQQAGLSWLTILKKMDALCEAFDNFDPQILITYDDKKIAQLLTTEGVIKNKLKINAMVHNAHIYFKICEKYQSLDNYLWSFIDYRPLQNAIEKAEDLPATTPLSDKISKDMKKQGFKFVGNTTVYAFMQAVGMVNDHLTSCDVYQFHSS